MNRTFFSVASLVVLAGAGVLAAWAIASSATSTRGSDASHPPELPPPTPTVAGTHDGDRAGLSATLEPNAPALSRAIDSLESGNFEAFFSEFAPQELPCTPDDYRGGVAPFCGTLGLPDGSTVALIREDFMIPRMVTVVRAEELLREVLVGSRPRVELVAKRLDDGGYFAAFRIDPVPDEGTPNSFRSITFRTDPHGRLLSFHRTYGPSTPADSVRLEEGYGRERLYDVLWVSEELIQDEEQRD